MSARKPHQPPRIWRVTVIEWRSHTATIEADTAEQAEALARQLWAENGEHRAFSFEDSGLDGVVVGEM
jgi:hypothetical protein